MRESIKLHQFTPGGINPLVVRAVVCFANTRHNLSRASEAGGLKAALGTFIRMGTKKSPWHFYGMEYRDTRSKVVQGIERGVWKAASVAGMLVAGKAETRSEAVAAAEKAIDRALAQKARPNKSPAERE
jgi:hypothetical protein